MAYRLEPNELVGPGLWRIFCEELQTGANLLAGKGDDAAVHDARRCLKRARSLVKLLRPLLGPRYERENSRLRSVGRKLSALRDAAALVQTFDDLRARHTDELKPEAFRSVRAGLLRRKKEMIQRVPASAVKFPKPGRPWTLSEDGFPALVPGLEETWRRGRKALSKVRRDPTPENFHTLRRRVKEHRFQLRLLEDMEPDKPHAKSIDKLDSGLGDEHNLVLLGAWLTEDPSSFGTHGDVEDVLNLIRKEQKQLETKSLSLAEKIYEEKPHKLVDDLKASWEKWRATDTADSVSSK